MVDTPKIVAAPQPSKRPPLSRAKKSIAIPLYPGITALDLVGTMEGLIWITAKSPYRLVTVAERIEPIPTDTPMRVVPFMSADVSVQESAANAARMRNSRFMVSSLEGETGPMITRRTTGDEARPTHRRCF